MTKGTLLALCAAATLTFAVPGHAQRPRTAGEDSTSLRERVGVDFVTQLLRSPDPDERLRAIERAGSLGTKEGAFFLASLAESGSSLGVARTDPRAFLALARALARYDDERARTGLLALLGVTPKDAGVDRLPSPGRGNEPRDATEQLTHLGRATAAIALACSGSERAASDLTSIARGGGPARGAAMLGLLRCPAASAEVFATSGGGATPAFLAFLGKTGDLRALPALLAAAAGEALPSRAAALVALGQMGDQRAAPLARSALRSTDARSRAAAVEALVLLDAPDRIALVGALLNDDATVVEGLRLAQNVSDAALTPLLVARTTSAEPAVRLAAVQALGRSKDDGAARALATKEVQAVGVHDCLLALARSPAPQAASLLLAEMRGPQRRLAVRAYVVRALVRRQTSSAAEDVVRAMDRGSDPADRAVAAFARVALGKSPVEHYLTDRDPAVRRGASAGVLARLDRSSLEAMARRLEDETDAATRQVLALALLDGRASERVPTSELLQRADAGQADGPLAVLALARRTDRRLAESVERYLTSSDPVIRAHAARGLAESSLDDAAGRLARAYAYEIDADVRHAVIAALIRRNVDRGAPARERTLRLAASLDPDGRISAMARLALSAEQRRPMDVAEPLPEGRESALIRLLQPNGRPPGAILTGAVLRSDGLAVPIAFDADGYALVTGLSSGDARLVLAPRVVSYESPSP